MDDKPERYNIARTSRFTVLESAYGGTRRWPTRLVKTLVALLILFGVLGFDYPVGIPSGAEFDQSNNGVWLESHWSNTLTTPAAVSAMVEEIEKHGISYVYADEGTLQPDGKLPRENFMYAGGLVEYIHRARHPIAALAWISGGNNLSLADSGVRARIVEGARFFVEQQDFDGVQLDIEPVPSGDPDFLRLLDELRAALKDKIISVAAMKWAPFTVRLGSANLVPYSWDSGYYREVARRSDQVVLMSYDSAIPFANLYIKYVGWQTAQVMDVLSDVADCDVLIGVPSYDTHTFWHTSAENLGSGLQGVIESLRDMRQMGVMPPNFKGVAIFEAGTTSPEEWSTYDHIWHAAR